MKTKIIQLFIVILLVVTTGCSSDNNADLPMIYVDQPKYALAKGSLEITAIAEVAAHEDFMLPVRFAGDAKAGIDFIVSEPYFYFKKGEDRATLKIERNDEHIQSKIKQLVVNLGQPPKEYDLAIMNYSVIELLSADGILVSFKNNLDILTLQSNYKIGLFNVKGSVYKVASDTDFKIEVDSKSTAIEGVHYEFTKSNYITVPKNKSEGLIGLNFLQKEAGKDLLILNISTKDGYAFGGNPNIEITIKGPYILNGTWAFDKISNLEYYEQNWFQDITKYPKGTTDDLITFEGHDYKSYTFTPQLKGDLKNYFGTESTTINFVSEDYKDLYEEGYPRQEVKYEIMKQPNINVNFSATKSKIREDLVGYRIIKINGEEVLECVIDNYEPTDFAADIYDMFGSMLEAPLRLHFKRVK